MDDAKPALLRVDSLVSGYGKREVLSRVSVEVTGGEIVALIGHNGAGKSTLLKAVFGLIPVWEGKVCLEGKELDSAKPRELLRASVAYVPQGNRVFTDLTVRENLQIGGVTLPKKEMLNEGIERALNAFPLLKSRLRQRAGTLSGGEKQMLALANALIVSPRLLLLDEPSLGLAPPRAKEALGRIQQLNRDKGVAILIVEQKVREVLDICQRVYSLKLGKVTYSGSPQELKENPDKLRRVFL